MSVIMKQLETRKATHNMTDIKFDRSTLFLMIDGKQIAIELDKISTKLFKASKIKRNFYKISPLGYGIYWPLIVEDLYIDSFLK